MSRSESRTPRSSSRSKRSTTNLANLRLAPLSARFTEAGSDNAHSDGQSAAFTDLRASHRSAPTSPRILSRSSSRRYAGGLSRRNSLYENNHDGPEEYDTYFGGVKDEQRVGGRHLQINGGKVPKAKSEAALGVPPSQRLAGHGVQRKQDRIYSPRSHHTSGTNTPRVNAQPADDWLARTAQATNTILLEQKGQSFIASRNSKSALAIATEDLTDEDDEGYEEMAAISARTTRSNFADDEMSPVSTRTSRWGSRYGSRRTSRRGSMVQVGAALRPLAGKETEGNRDAVFDQPHTLPMTIEPDFDDSSADESRFSSLGGIVDKIIGFNLFHGEEREETGTESEAEGAAETETEARQRRAVERGRRREEKERLVDAQQRSLREGVEGRQAWTEDARWLIGVAKEALF